MKPSLPIRARPKPMRRIGRWIAAGIIGVGAVAFPMIKKNLEVRHAERYATRQRAVLFEEGNRALAVDEAKMAEARRAQTKPITVQEFWQKRYGATTNAVPQAMMQLINDATKRAFEKQGRAFDANAVDNALIALKDRLGLTKSTAGRGNRYALIQAWLKNRRGKGNTDRTVGDLAYRTSIPTSDPEKQARADGVREIIVETSRARPEDKELLVRFLRNWNPPQ